jgi:hypothetical protein
MQVLVSELDTFILCRYHFIREDFEDSFINIVFFKIEDDDSYFFTKNVNKVTYKRHLVKFLAKIDDRIDVIGRVLE